MTAHSSTVHAPRPGTSGLLAAARVGLTRLSPIDARRAQRAGAVLVDIRPRDLRRREGEIAGSIRIERNVLEWRLDPRGDHRAEFVTSPDVPVVIVCQEGYASSLAAASLLALGLTNVADLDGGIAGWREAGLPLVAGGGPAIA